METESLEKILDRKILPCLHKSLFCGWGIISGIGIYDTYHFIQEENLKDSLFLGGISILALALTYGHYKQSKLDENKK